MATDTPQATPRIRAFCLPLPDGTDYVVDAEDSGRRWNGWGVPILTEAQADEAGRTIGEPLMAGPCEGLCWSVADDE